MFKGGRGPPRLAFGAGGGLAGRGCLGFRAGGGVSRTGSGSMGGGDGESRRVGRLQMSNKALVKSALTCSTYAVCSAFPNIDSYWPTRVRRFLAFLEPIPLFLGILGWSGLEVSRFWLPLTRFEKELVRRKHQGVSFKVHQL